MQHMAEQTRCFFSGRQVLVVGGEGFLAQNAMRHLVALGADVTVLVREQRRAPHPGIRRLLTGDVREVAVAQEAVRGQQVVLNFAGVTSAVTSNRMPSVSLLIECLPHLTLLDVCAEQAERPLVVFPSSRLVYGKPTSLPVTEDHATNPLTVYGIHKLAVEHYLRVYQRMHGVPYLTFRISNPFGPHQNARRGYGILNTFIQRALAGQPIQLFGDGMQLRDFIHVDDLLTLMLRAIATPACHNDIYNVGGPQAVPLAEAIGMIADEIEQVEIVHKPWPDEHRLVETGDYVGDISKLARHLPDLVFTPLREGIAAVVAAYREAGLAAAEAEPMDAALDASRRPAQDLLTPADSARMAA